MFLIFDIFELTSFRRKYFFSKKVCMCRNRSCIHMSVWIVKLLKFKIFVIVLFHRNIQKRGIFDLSLYEGIHTKIHIHLHICISIWIYVCVHTDFCNLKYEFENRNCICIRKLCCGMKIWHTEKKIPENKFIIKRTQKFIQIVISWNLRK